MNSIVSILATFLLLLLLRLILLLLLLLVLRLMTFIANYYFYYGYSNMRDQSLCRVVMYGQYTSSVGKAVKLVATRLGPVECFPSLQSSASCD